MDEKDFKKHLKDLAHGHHHPEEHDWTPESTAGTGAKPVRTKPDKSKLASKPRSKKTKAA